MKISDKTGDRKFTILIKKESEGGYSGQCLELPGAISQGETMDELKENMVDAIHLVLEYIESKAKAEKRTVVEISA